MAEYIEREALIKELSAGCIPIDDREISQLIDCNESIRDIINAMPTADVRSERYGHWVKESKMMGAFQRNLCICNICGLWYDEDSGEEIFKYCPNCGAKMDGKDGNKDD